MEHLTVKTRDGITAHNKINAYTGVVKTDDSC